MPSRGYRKGMSDRKIPLTARINTRVPLDVATYLTHQAHLRSITRAKLTREMLTAEARQLRLELPQPRVNKDTHRVLAGAANNLNQLVRQARLQRLHLLEHDTQRVLTELLAVIRQLPL